MTLIPFVPVGIMLYYFYSRLQGLVPYSLLKQKISKKEASDVLFEGRHKPIHGGLAVAVRATDTLK